MSFLKNDLMVLGIALGGERTHGEGKCYVWSSCS